MRSIYIFLFLSFLLGLVSGCTGDENQADDRSNLTTIQTNNIDQSISNRAKAEVMEMEETKNVKSVNTNQELLLAANIKQFDRFQVKSIEKSIKSKLKKSFPDQKINVSTDLKIFLEIEKLEDALLKENTNKKTFKKEMQRIKNLMKEKT